MITVNKQKLLPILSARFVDAIQSHMDAKAKELGYDDIKSAVTYADEPSVEKFQQEGQAFRAWRSLVWAHCYELLAGIDPEGELPTEESIIAGLPALDLSSGA